MKMRCILVGALFGLICFWLMQTLYSITESSSLGNQSNVGVPEEHEWGRDGNIEDVDFRNGTNWVQLVSQAKMARHYEVGKYSYFFTGGDPFGEKILDQFDVSISSAKNGKVEIMIKILPLRDLWVAEDQRLPSVSPFLFSFKNKESPDSLECVDFPSDAIQTGAVVVGKWGTQGRKKKLIYTVDLNSITKGDKSPGDEWSVVVAFSEWPQIPSKFSNFSSYNFGHPITDERAAVSSEDLTDGSQMQLKHAVGTIEFSERVFFYPFPK